MGNKIFSLKNTMFWIGVLVVFGTHISIIAMGLPESAINAHAGINLGAGVLIVLSNVLS